MVDVKYRVCPKLYAVVRRLFMYTIQSDGNCLQAQTCPAFLKRAGQKTLCCGSPKCAACGNVVNHDNLDIAVRTICRKYHAVALYSA